MRDKCAMAKCLMTSPSNIAQKLKKTVIMFINSTPFLARSSRFAGFMAIASAMSFLTQVHAADPTIVSVAPANGATGVSPSAPVVFTFSEAMDTTVTVATFVDTNFATLTTTATWSDDNKILTCTPSPPFPSPDTILWSVAGQDTSGNALPGDEDGIFLIGASVSTPCGASPHTNTEFVLEESWLYVQTSASAPTLNPLDPYAIIAEVSLVSNLSATAATLTNPKAAVSNLTDIVGTGQSFLLSAAETNVTELNASWPTGDYVFKTTGASLPAVTVDLDIAQPNAPEVANFALAQAVDSTKAFMLTWDAFSSRAGTNEIGVNIGYDACAGTGFYTNLPGTATSVTIPADALLPATSYSNSILVFINTTGISNASPKYTAGQVKSSATSFTLTTIGGSNGSSPLSVGIPVWLGGTLTVNFTGSPGKLITVQTSATLRAGSWTTLLTTNSGSGTVTVTNTVSKSVPALFYRGYQ
jgi:methionine-rich copper-binding protein CopC